MQASAPVGATGTATGSAPAAEVAVPVHYASAPAVPLPPPVSPTLFKGLSVVSWAFLLIWAVIFLLLGLISPWNWIIQLIIYVPPVIVLRYVWRRSKENVGPEYHEPLDSIVRFFATGFLPAALVVLIVELIVSVVLVLVLYRGRLQEALGLLGAQDGAEVDGDGSGTGGYAGQPASYVTMDINLLLFLFCSAYVTAATIEEVAKVAIVRYACCPTRPCCAQHVTQRVHARTTLLYMLAGAIGFSTIENIGYTFGSVIGPTAVYDGWAIAIQALVRALVSLPVHILCAALTASRLVRRDREKRELPNPAEAKGMMWVLGPAIAVHGTFNFQAMTLAVALNGMVDEVGGGVLMLGLAILILCMASCAFLRQWETHAEPLAAGGHAAQMVTVGSGHGHGHGHVHGHGRGGRGSDAV